MAAGLTTFLKTLRSTSSTIKGEKVNQIIIYTPAQAVLLHGVTEEYFILAMVRRDGLMGKVRFKLLAASLRLREEMS